MAETVRPSRFLSLPPEIRDQIYGHALSVVSTVRTDEAGYDHYNFETSLFHVSRQVADESSLIFSRVNTFVRVETPWQQAEQHVAEQGRVPLLLTGERAQTFPHWHMRASIRVPEMVDVDTVKCRFIVLVDDLDKFCRLWYFSELTHPGLNEHLDFHLYLRKWLTPKLQQAVLMPFGKVKGLHNVTVENAEQYLVEAMKREMSEPYPTVRHCLEECTRLNEAGSQALGQNKPAVALDLYFQAYAAIHIIISGPNNRLRDVWGDRFFEAHVCGGKYDKQYAASTRVELRVKVVANILQAYSKMSDWDSVKFWGERSIDTVRKYSGAQADEPRPNFPAAREWGLVYYFTGLADQNMNEMDSAKIYFGIAARWLPNDEVVQAAKRRCNENTPPKNAPPT